MGLSNQERMGIIYKITFPNGKVYIGQTIRNLNQRIAAHISVAFNKHSNCFKTKLSRAIRKDYDKMKWSVLFTVPEFYLDKIEQWTINSFDSYKNGLNSTLGGKPIMQGKCHTKNTKKKMSKSRKGKKRPAFSQEWRNNISKSQKGIPKPKNKQHRISLSKALKGNKNGEGNRGKIRTEKMKEQNSIAHQGSKNHKSKITESDVLKIILLRNQGLTYKAIGNLFNIEQSSVRRIVSGKTWKHVNRSQIEKLNDIR